MEFDYGDRVGKLAESVKGALDTAVNEALVSNRSITVRGGGESIVLWSVLDDVLIDNEVWLVIIFFTKQLQAISSKHTLPDELQSESIKHTVGSLLKAFSSVKKTQNHLDKVKDLLRESHLDIFYSDYVEELYQSYSIAMANVKVTWKGKRSYDGHFQEYCSLCWRLVHKYRRINFGDEGYSNHYCKYHHPNINSGGYHRDKRKVLNAARRRNSLEDREKLKIIGNTSTNRSSSARALYALTGTFSQAYKVISSSNTQEDDGDRLKSVEELMEIASTYFPDAYAKLKDIPQESKTSWGHFFCLVVSRLDPSGLDIESWQDTNELSEKIPIEMNFVPESRWGTLFNVLQRYQSFIKIQKVPQPRGPEKGAVAKNDGLRNKISELANNQIKHNGRINASVIAREVEISPQRASRLIKELGLR
ncbi:hypothetical protein [Vibrio sp. ABG19]|uniref:hypothetical protein n=1 Tax=Vibrio sp. ABG19 TaxID=2817385 RepID=UPI00249E0FBD|nr:hypothetical protein [Vibrio sp. ABG19]WGY48396.1 hypothetical protein J0X00_12540 [Vibrio sp. ABG19]